MDETKTLEQEIAEVTTALVAEHGRAAMVAEFGRVTGLGPRVFDLYRKGERLPDKFMLFYLGLVDEGVLGEWAGKCLVIRARYGFGLPMLDNGEG